MSGSNQPEEIDDAKSAVQINSTGNLSNAGSRWSVSLSPAGSLSLGSINDIASSSVGRRQSSKPHRLSLLSRSTYSLASGNVKSVEPSSHEPPLGHIRPVASSITTSKS